MTDTSINDGSRKVPKRTLLERDIDIESLLPMARSEGNRKKPIYEIHKWWARRLGVNSRALLLASTIPSNRNGSYLWKDFFSSHNFEELTIFDPFMGGGTSVVEAAKLGAKVIGNDIDPMAWFITKKEVDEWDELSFRRELESIDRVLSRKLKGYYRTRDVNGNQADVVYYFWVEIVQCPCCRQEFEGHVNYLLCDDGDHYSGRRRFAFCSSCHAITSLEAGRMEFDCGICSTHVDVHSGPMSNRKYICPHCGAKGMLRDLNSRTKPFEKRLFAIEYLDERGNTQFKQADDRDLALFDKAKQELVRHRDDLPIPHAEIPTANRLDSRPIVFGYHRYEEMFNERQLLCLGTILKEILNIDNGNTREYFLLAFSDCLAANNMFCSYAFGYRKLTPLFGIHSYRHIFRPVEGNVWGADRGRGSFLAATRKLIRGKRFGQSTWEYCCLTGEPTRVITAEKCNVRKDLSEHANRDEVGYGRVHLTNRDSRNLDWIKDGTVDIVLTDPPYYDNLPYSEMSDFYYVWLKDNVKWPTNPPKEHAPMEMSLVVDPRNNGKDHRRFTEGLTEVFKECRRVLGPEGILVFTFHHKKPGAWASLAEAVMASGFTTANVIPVLSEGRSGFHSSAGSLKWDEVFVCRPSQKMRRSTYSNTRMIDFVEARMITWQERLKLSDSSLSNGDELSLRMGLLTEYLTRSTCDLGLVRDVFESYDSSIVLKSDPSDGGMEWHRNLRVSGLS